MAEYRKFHCPYGDDYEGGDECDRCEQYELCMETPTADVVERSEYEVLQQENKQLKETITNEVNNSLKVALEYKDLRSKIDKAIEEINDIPVLFCDFPLGKTQVVRKDVVLAILKRNLGE